jgi:hypothetical protein
VAVCRRLSLADSPLKAELARGAIVLRPLIKEISTAGAIDAVQPTSETVETVGTAESPAAAAIVVPGCRSAEGRAGYGTVRATVQSRASGLSGAS